MPECNHRRARGLCFECGHSGILDLREEKRARSCVEFWQRIIGDKAEHLHRRSRHRAEPFEVASGSSDLERELQAITGIDEKIEPLVRHETSEGQEVVPVPRGFCIERGLQELLPDGRVNHRALPAIQSLDAFLRRRGIRDEEINAFARGHIPASYRIEPILHMFSQQFRYPEIFEIRFFHLPRVADGRVAVAHVHGGARGDDAFSHRVRRAHDQIEVSQIKPLHRAWHPREEHRVGPEDLEHLLQSARMNVRAAQRWQFLSPRHGGKDRGIRKFLVERTHDVLRSAIGGKPVGDQCSAHARVES